MSTFGIQKNYAEFNFEEVSVNDLEVISGGSGIGGVIWAASTISAAAFSAASFPGTWTVPFAGGAFIAVGFATAGIAGGLAYFG